MCSVVILGSQLIYKKDVDFDVIRDRGALYRETLNGSIENSFTLKLLNKSEFKKSYWVDLEGLSVFEWLGKRKVSLGAGEQVMLPIRILVQPERLKLEITPLEFSVWSETNEFLRESETRFIYPNL